jgi:hypothetical protein
MALQNHLLRRNARYYWRGRVPTGIVAAFGRSHICLSLGTSQAPIARLRCQRVSLALAELYERLRTYMTLVEKAGLTRADFDRIVRRLFREVLDQGEARRAAEVPSDDPQDGWEMVDLPDDHPDGAEEVWRKTSHIEADHEVDEWSERLARNDVSAIAPTVLSILGSEGLVVDQAGSEYRQLLRQALRARLKAAEVDRDREHNIYREDDELFEMLSLTVPASPDMPAARTEPEAIPTPPLSTYVEPWIIEKRRTIQWTNQTEKQNRNSLELLIKIVGDKPLHLYTRKEIEHLHTTLEAIPANYKSRLAMKPWRSRT